MNGAGAPSAIPAYLIAQARWLFWRNKTVTNKKTREKRTTKAPFSYRDGKQPCDAHNPRNWVSYDKIAAALARTPGAWDGAGFDLGIIEALGEVVIGLDLDTCLDADGRLAVWANDYLTAMPSYAEVSPSGTGIKIVAHPIRGPPERGNSSASPRATRSRPERACSASAPRAPRLCPVHSYS